MARWILHKTQGGSAFINADLVQIVTAHPSGSGTLVNMVGANVHVARPVEDVMKVLKGLGDVIEDSPVVVPVPGVTKNGLHIAR